ncbi:hypothetical protein [Adhaeretor mobilis]|uniref:HEAT repeat domain-containing protein n=1 Tax=Adhaeretor mobilis TaxID=1930276 RepID=A0A517MWF7_9BACT|nr:hypothetical protein [Adhaeretor mobilis]QDS99212.1 hypothetical protein HG15A2_25040 [Adhaeretor mobilis]
MSIAVLNQVYDETRRLTIAGSNLAVGDFRLKKLVEPLRKSSNKAPVFTKVADSIEQLVDGDEKNSPQALLDLSSLLLAILYTQGATGVKGATKAIESLEVGISTTQVSSRVLKPLLEALSTTGSGRLETVQEAFDRGAFNDLRLINPAINALNDVYPELADFVAEKVLPKYGPAILPEIKDRIDIKGRAGNVRRLKLLYQLDPETARPIVEAAFDSGSKEMKIAALCCLGDSKKDLPHLLDQIKAKAKDVRRVVLDRLSLFKGKEVDNVFEQAICSGDVDLVVKPIRETRNTRILAIAQQQTKTCFDDLLKAKEKKKRESLVNRLDVLISCFYGRNEKSTSDMLLGLFNGREKLTAIIGGDTLLESLCSVMVSTGDKKLLLVVADIHSTLDDEATNAFLSSVVAVLVTRTPKQAFDELRGYYDGTKGSRRSKKGQREIVASLLGSDSRDHTYGYFLECHGGDVNKEMLSKAKWDPRWIDLAIETEDVEVVCRLANAKHKTAGDFLVSWVQSRGHKLDGWESTHALEKLIEMKHKQAPELLLATIIAASKKKNNHYGISYWLFPLISKLPKSATKKVESALEGLSESYIDQITPHLVTLKQKTR